MVTATQIAIPSNLVVLDERWFKSSIQSNLSAPMDGESHSIRLNRTSYVWLFSGRRGAGKSVAMTLFAVMAVILYNVRIIANYNIEFLIRRYRPDGKSYLQHVQSEKLDFEKLLMQSDDYKHVLICLDEAPDVISHLSSQTWKNRLINAFIRQIRHGFNSVLLAAQDESLIDKSFRWQIDIETACKDLSIILGDNSGVAPGENINIKWYDRSGQWTGESSRDLIRKGEDPVVDEIDIYPQVLFGDKTHKPVFDSWQDINILESLMRVDMRMTSLKIGGQNKDFFSMYPITGPALRLADKAIDAIFERPPDEQAVWQKAFYNSFAGGLNHLDRSNLGKLINECGVKRGGNKNKPWFNFDQFDRDKFKGMINAFLNGGTAA